MPLRCLRDGLDLLAFDIPSEEAWERLRTENSSTGILRLPCCQSKVVLRTSKLGTRHFAHAARGDCAWAHESAQHLLAKRLVGEAIRQAGWEAQFEKSGTTPAGEEWRADVLALKPGNSAKVAFEIQWSRQATADTEARQARYKAAGIRGLWLFQQADVPISEATPAFRLVELDSEQSFRVDFPSSGYYERGARRPHPEDEPQWGQQASLQEFVRGALSGRLQFAPALRQPVPVQVMAAATSCWNCKQETRVLTELQFMHSAVGAPGTDVSIAWDEISGADEGRFLEDFVGRYLVRERLTELGIGAIKMRNSNTVGAAYYSNGCRNCDRIQGNHYVAQMRAQAMEVFRLQVQLDAGLAEQLPGLWNAVNRWVLR